MVCVCVTLTIINVVLTYVDVCVVTRVLTENSLNCWKCFKFCEFVLIGIITEVK